MRKIAVALLVVGTLAGCATPDEEKRFREECADRGGFVAQTGDSGLFTVHVDCIVNNKVVYLPGFA